MAYGDPIRRSRSRDASNHRRPHDGGPRGRRPESRSPVAPAPRRNYGPPIRRSPPPPPRRDYHYAPSWRRRSRSPPRWTHDDRRPSRWERPSRRDRFVAVPANECTTPEATSDGPGRHIAATTTKKLRVINKSPGASKSPDATRRRRRS